MVIINKNGKNILKGGAILMKKISKKSIIVWRIRFLLLFVFVAFVLGAVGIFNIKLSVILVLISIIFAIVMIVIYCPKRYDQTVFSIIDGKISIRKNLIFRVHYSVLVKKIQYIEIIQSPIQRWLNLCSVVFHTAGSTIILGQLSTKQAIKIKEISYINGK